MNKIKPFIGDHEGHARDYILNLVPEKKTFWCKIGFHHMHYGYTKDGGGTTFNWKYCLRCYRGSFIINGDYVVTDTFHQ